eukprot:scaffold591_cov65-Phaeocystis_antarctica.AAC.1
MHHRLETHSGRTVASVVIKYLLGVSCYWRVGSALATCYTGVWGVKNAVKPYRCRRLAPPRAAAAPPPRWALLRHLTRSAGPGGEITEIGRISRRSKSRGAERDGLVGRCENRLKTAENGPQKATDPPPPGEKRVSRSGYQSKGSQKDTLFLPRAAIAMGLSADGGRPDALGNNTLFTPQQPTL